MSLFDLTDRVAIVTGSSRGIGRSIAEALAEHGANVVVSSRKIAACEAVAKHINEKVGGGKAVAIAASISAKDDLRRLVDQTLSVWGRIDTLVCNAASNPHYGGLSSISDEQFRKVLQNNVLSNHWLIQMVLPQMIARRSGSIIVVSSIGGLRGSDKLGAYDISKAADLQLARNLAVECGPHNVRVNCIAPGLVRTDFARALWDDPIKLEWVNAHTPLRRIGEPREIAGAAVFLAADASTFMTGREIVIDGGATIIDHLIR
jgi:NAD(P)-dependent dehydrogenase (short-subunit alcohol dehydrogenase family)